MPKASPPKGTTKTARPSTNQRSTPPKGDVSYFFAWASLYFLASSTQHSRPSFFVARCAVSTATPRLDGIATGRARTGTGSSGLARAAREARAWMRPRGGAAARMDTAMASIARVLVSKIRDVTMMSWHLGRNATSFGAIAGNGKRRRRGGQLVYRYAQTSRRRCGTPHRSTTADPLFDITQTAHETRPSPYDVVQSCVYVRCRVRITRDVITACPR